MMKKIIITGLALMASVCAAAGDEAPRRIVSYNLCADQLLLALADPDQIAGLSPYARDASLSVMAAQAQKYPRLGWDTEYVIGLSPDLVLTGPTDRPTRAILDASGLRVVQIDLVSDLSQAEQQIRDIAKLVGHPERGEALVRQLANAERNLAASALKPPRTASVIERGGYSEGTASLVTAMLDIAGLRPLPGAPGGFGGYISMETLLTEGPDILVLRDVPADAGDQSALFITHPALKAKYGTNRRIEFASRYSLCGGPALVQGLNTLRESLARLHL
ncbi:MAG: ABC transporter substrate-binding protein [Bradyrhizobiaceae bacterium]|nr:MAG: ABC transporter substrate-binding protein [Bradyrhizobiaceae bacterium]